MEQENENQPEKLKGRALGLVALIIGIPIATLSGLCSIGIAAQNSGPNALQETLGSFAIGALGYVPAGLLVWAGIRLRKQGYNAVSNILIILFILSILTVIWLINGITL